MRYPVDEKYAGVHQIYLIDVMQDPGPWYPYLGMRKIKFHGFQFTV